MRPRACWANPFADFQNKPSFFISVIHSVPLGNHLVRFAKYGSWSGAIRFDDQSCNFHGVDDRRGACKSDSQPSLQNRSRRTMHLYANAQRRFEEFVMSGLGVFQSSVGVPPMSHTAIPLRQQNSNIDKPFVIEVGRRSVGRA